MKKILITGGAGFLGSHLCQKLLNDDTVIYCLDNFSTGSKRNIVESDNLIPIDHNIEQPIELEVDEIYNLASPASPKRYQIDPTGTIRTNILGAVNVLELAKQCHAKIVQSSTAEVYGSVDFKPNQNVFSPRHCYISGKQAAETLFNSYRDQYQVDVKIARLFNTYGPNLQITDGRAIVNFIVQSLQNKDITINGLGDQIRNFCFATDTVDALIALMASDSAGPVDIGNSNSITIADLANRIIELTGSQSRVVLTGTNVVEPLQPVPDLSATLQMIGWKPTVDLNAGLQLTIDYFRSVV